MHILHLESGRNLYGGALQVLYLMRGLKARGCRNTLVCAKGSAIAGAVSKGTAEVFPIPMTGELDPSILFRLRRLLRVARPDIMHVHSRRGADWWGGIAASLEGCQAVVSRRVDNPEPGWLARHKYRRYGRVITISEGIRKVLLGEGIPAEKIACVPSAVDVEAYGEVCARQWFRNQFGLPAEVRTIGVIAQLIERKGHRYLIAAAPAILSRFPETRFIFFGQGPLRDELQQWCREARIGDKVRFAGFRTDLPRLLACLDLVVHPATMEGLGVALLQAAACGVPIVASRAGGIPEIVQHGRNGYLVPPADATALAEAVTALWDDAGLAERFGRGGREIVRSRFSIDAMVAGNLRVYQELLGG